MSKTTESWQVLLLELFSDEMKNRWGWGKVLRGAPGTREAPSKAASRASIDTDGLDIPYFCGRITVVFGERVVACHAFDQNTPADEHWELRPEDSWWSRAGSCNWPLRDSE